MIRTLIALILLIVVCSSRSFAQTIDQLEKAYQEQSPEQLKQFFDTWAKELSPATQVQRSAMSPAVQEAYRVFETFYNPHEIANRGGSEFGNNIYSGFNYLIIQDKFRIYQKEKLFYTDEEEIAYAIENINKNVEEKYRAKWIASIRSGDKYFVDTYGPNNKSEREDSLKTLIDSVKDFRPDIIQTKSTPLYLTNKYSKLLDDFLGKKHIPFGTGGIMNTARPEAEGTKRQAFLQSYIKIFHGHWGGDWQYISYPSISSLVFDKDMKYVKAYYGMIYEGGEAFFKLEDNGWKLLSIKRTWIQ